MKNKKLFSVIACVLAAVMSVLVFGCTDGGGSTPTKTRQPSIELRSDSYYDILVGARLTLMYAKYPANAEVECVSDNPDVVVVDKYATVDAVGAGEATVTISLKDYPDKSIKVRFKVSRNNFMTRLGLYGGVINFGEQATGGPVKIETGQAQLLANALGQNWYFKTHIERTGYTDGDSYGMWGVGSFLVDAGHPIGDTMFWYILREHGDGRVNALYGGWKYATTVPNHNETPITDEAYSIESGVDFTIIRRGITHYVIATFAAGTENEQSFKYVYDVPLFEETNTYPGVFGQNQKLTVSDYSMSNDETEVLKELSNFQKAEGISINGLTDALTPGNYRLTSTVEPLFTIDKSATYALKDAVDGVSVTQAGDLTVNASAIGESFTVVATAESNTEVKGEKTYTVIEKTESSSELFDIGQEFTVKGATGSAREVQFDDANKKATVTARSSESGDAYIPLAVNADKWYVTASVQNRATAPLNTELGIMSATGGYMDYVKLGISYGSSAKSGVNFTRQGGTPIEFNESASTTGINTLGLIKTGNVYYLEINGKFTRRITCDLTGSTMPVLYSIGAGAYFTNVTLITDGDEIDEYVSSKPFYVGSYVDVDGDNYTLRGVDLGAPGGGGDTLDWPPDNEYINGIKSSKSFSGSYSIEFTMSQIAPLSLSGYYDAKILIYLKSERVTSSLQFVIKNSGSGTPTTVKFTPNLDDATWTEYDLPDGVNLFGGETSVKVVKKADCVELYLNGVQVYAGEEFMNNRGYWNGDTVATPGIGAFLCSVKISNPVFTQIV
ncbi:MAG: Ig-like domain-containing protein [Clostridiales bacterium]|nr:Ig-like domain-containing protein [Clostridiales bacterium]